MLSLYSILGTIAQNGGNEGATDTILWIIAAVLVIVGIVTAIRGQILLGDRPHRRRAPRRPGWRERARLTVA